MKYIGKKFIMMAATLLAVSFLVFLSFAVMSGDAATSMLGTQATPEKIAALREEMGLNEPFLNRYFHWVGSFVRGDMGTSYSYGLPVREMVVDKIPVTLSLTLLAFLVMTVTAVPLGIYTAKHEGRAADRAVCVINQVIMAVPPFFAGILITFLFGRIFRLFTPGGYVSYKDNVAGFFGYLFFPALAIALPKAAMAVKLLRSSLIGEVGRDYVRTAFSRGNKSNQVFYRHILKNAVIPLITFLGMALADMVAGSIIIEQVFSIPGLGRILLNSISNRDYPVVEAVILCVAFIVVAINLLVDIVYRLIDPRIESQP